MNFLSARLSPPFFTQEHLLPDTAYSSIIDNLGDNTLLAAISRMGDGGEELLVASAFFSLDALLLLADALGEFDPLQMEPDVYGLCFAFNMSNLVDEAEEAGIPWHLLLLHRAVAGLWDRTARTACSCSTRLTPK